MTPLAFLLSVSVSCFGTRQLKFIPTPILFCLRSKLDLTRGKGKNPTAGLEVSLEDLSPNPRMDRFRGIGGDKEGPRSIQLQQWALETARNPGEKLA